MRLTGSVDFDRKKFCWRPYGHFYHYYDSVEPHLAISDTRLCKSSHYVVEYAPFGMVPISFKYGSLSAWIT